MKLQWITDKDAETLDYLLGWYEEHPDEFPESLEDLLEQIKNSYDLVKESNEYLEGE